MTAQTPSHDSSTDPAVHELVDALAQLSFAVQLVLTEVATAHDLSLTQLRLLGILRDRTPAMADLAAGLGLDRSSVTGLVDRAEKRGLVRRQPHPQDGRGIQVRLTAAGRRLLVDVSSPVVVRLQELLHPLSGRERAALVGLVRKVLDAG